MAKPKGNILVICSHSDDQVIGCGGAMARYAAEGYTIKTMIMSFGESVKPHLKREVITRQRVKESQRADRILGGDGVLFLGLREMHFEEDFKSRKIEEGLKEKIREIDPVKIFTHSADDAHPDHRATLRIVLRLYRRMMLRSELYTFEVWHIFNLRKRNKPKLVVDISDTFDLKIRALLSFRSQINLSNFYNYLVFNNFFFFLIHIKDFLNGLRFDCTYAEVFYKLR